MKYIYHHLGLGDHIICNGLVRKIILENEKYSIFSKKHYSESVRFMYRDLNNLEIYEINDDMHAASVLSTEISEKTILIGHSATHDIMLKNNCNWDQAFYLQMNIPFGERWNSFFVQRDLESENNLSIRLNPDGKEFALIHSKDSQGIDRIDYKKIDEKLEKIFVEPNGPIFNYMTLIEKAKEIHCIDSSFKHLVESMNTNSTLYYHKNYKARTDNKIPHTTNKNWIVI